MSHQFRKGDIAYYKTAITKETIRARVETCHRDGDYTVKALFDVDYNGKDRGTYLGFKFRMGSHLLHKEPTK